MKKYLAKVVVLVLCLAFVFTVTGCNQQGAQNDDPTSSSTQAPGVIQPEVKYRFVMVCNVLSEPFWNTVRKGMSDAAEMLGVEAEYVGPQEWDVAKQVNTFETILETEVDGVAVFVSEGAALQKVIQTSIDKGIPVITFNNDAPDSARMAYVGQNEYEAGQEMGKKIASLIPSDSVVLACNHHPGQTGITDRIAGLGDAVSGKGITVEEVETPEADPAQILTTLESYYAKNQNVAAFLTFNPNVASTAAKWLEEKDLAGTIRLGCFDTSEEILENIKKGVIDFTIDQQPYLQGFQSIMQLYLYKEYGLYPVTMNTGGAIVDASNVDLVADLVTKGYR